MSRSVTVQGFKPPDEQWKKMKAVYDACTAAGMSIPEEVEKFFNYDIPDDAGVKLTMTDLDNLGAVKDYATDWCMGYEVELAKLPSDVKILRFYMS